MPITIPDLQAITNGSNNFDAQAIVDNVDIAALAGMGNGNGVITGCQVTAQSSPNMTVQVSSGWVLVNGSYVQVSSVSSLTIAAADTDDRRDIISVNSSGTVSVTKGTDCGTGGWIRTSAATALGPIKPSIPSNSVILAEVYVEGSAGTATTSVANINIIDKTTVVCAMPGTLLKRVQYAPSTATTYTVVAVATGLTALDTTNLVVTFIAPASGTVRVNLQGLVKGSVAAKSCAFGLVTTTGSPGTLVSGSVIGLASISSATPADYGQSSQVAQIITGLSAGTSYTWYFAASCTTATDTTIVAQGVTAVTTMPTGAPALIEVYAA